MRTDIEQRILDAFDSEEGVSLDLRLQVASTRHFSTDYTNLYSPSWAEDVGIKNYPTPEDGKVIGGLWWNVLVYERELYLSNSFDQPQQITSGSGAVSCEPYNRPSIVWGFGSITVFYYSGTTVYRAIVDETLFEAGTYDCILETEAVADIGLDGAIHAISHTEIVVLAVDDGGVRAIHLTESGGSWTQTDSTGRFIHPTELFYEDLDLVTSSLNFSGAVLFGDEIFVYLTMPDGNVMAMSYDRTRAMWSDTFEAVPADLSNFAIANVFEHNDTVYMVGQFQRVDPLEAFSSSYVYGLMLSSTDGHTFQLDRTTAFTGGDTEALNASAYRYFGGYVNNPDSRYSSVYEDGIIYSANNCWMLLPLFYDLKESINEVSVEDIIGFTGPYDGRINIKIANGDERYSGTINEGDALDIEVGVFTSIGAREWFTFIRCLVVSVDEEYADGVRGLNVGVMSWSMARLQDMTHPFYMELQSKQSIRDDCDEFDNLYRASEEGYLVFPLSIDLWGEGQIQPEGHDAGETTEYKTGDLKSQLGLIAYPQIQTLPFYIEMWGWSRSGSQTPYEGGTGDQPSDLEAPNDRVACKLYIERDGVADEIEIVVETTGSGSHDHHPQTWYATENGSYPVILQADSSCGLQEDDVIKEMGYMFINDRTPHNAEAYHYPERIMAPTISMKVRSYEETWAEVGPAKVDKTVVVVTTNGIAYTEEFDTATPTWHDFNDGLSDRTDIEDCVYDKTRKKYFCICEGSIYRADGLGEEWQLIHHKDGVYAMLDALKPHPSSCDTPLICAYKGIGALDNGTILISAGGTSGASRGCDRLTYIFRSTNGLSSMEVADVEISPVGHVISGLFYFKRTSDGQIWAIGYVGWAYAGQTQYFSSDDDGKTWELRGSWNPYFLYNYLMPISEFSGWLIAHNGADGVASGSSTLLSDDFDNDKFAVLPETIFGTSTPNFFKQRAVGQVSDGSKIAVAATSDEFYLATEYTLNEYDRLVPTWVKINDCERGSVYPSAVSDSIWILGGKACEIYQVEGDGETIKDKTGNLADIINAGDRFVSVVTSIDGPPTDTDLDGQELVRSGVPVVYFSQKPYYTINCEVAAEYFLSGDNVWGGVVCLGHDGSNYVGARASEDSVELVKVRDSLVTVLASASASWPQPYGWIYLRHKDGVFEVRTRKYNDDWSDPLISYEWSEDDGVMLLDQHISHLGIFAMRAAPYARICGYDPQMGNFLGLLPGSQYINDFPSSGTARIQGTLYTYTGVVTVDKIEGPFGGRNVSGPYNYDVFSGIAAEISRFYWYDISHRADCDGYYLCTDTGVGWLITDVDHKPWITTGGVKVYLKNRGRFFSPQAGGNVIGLSIRCWLTGGLSGLALDNPADEDVTHRHGTIVHSVADEIVRLYEFAASSGHEELTDRCMIDKITRMAGGDARFPGDISYTSKALTGTPWTIS